MNDKAITTNTATMNIIQADSLLSFLFIYLFFVIIDFFHQFRQEKPHLLICSNK